MQRSMDFRITGNKKLSGEITTNMSKNGAMGLLAATLLNKGTTTLHGIPEIEEIARMCEVYKSMGISVEAPQKGTLVIETPEDLFFEGMDIEAAKKMRSSIMLIGAASGRLKHFKLPYAGGCKMGARTIAAHKHGLEQLGIQVVVEDEYYEIDTGKRSSGEILMYEASDTATENVLMAASTLEGKSIIDFAQQNYMVLDVCYFLEALGVKIEGINSRTLTVTGVRDIATDVEHWNSEDPIESMLWITTALMTQSMLTVKRCPIDFLKLELLKLELMGAKFDTSDEYLSYNNKTKLVDITVHPSTLTALEDKIHALPYPGINTDNLPFFAPLATQAEGVTLVHDWMWENRAIYFTELNRLGADVRLADPHRVFIYGPTPLKAAQVVCPPALRPAAIIMVAMLGAEGTSILRNVYSIKRGYENIAERLNSLGAEIEVLHE